MMLNEKKNINPLISIITVSYNSASTIRRTIESVLMQTYDAVEYIIVDGKSDDGTVQIAREYEMAMKQRGYFYKIISEADKGIYDAMNKGIDAAQGELIGIINSDDWYERDALKRVAETYNLSHFDMLYADLRIWKQNADGSLKEKMIKHSRYRKLAVSRDWNHPTTFLTRNVYRRFRYKVESLHDDWDLVLRIRKAGFKIIVLNEVLANFRMGGISNEKNLKKCIERGRARYKIYRNNGYSRLYLLECILIETVKWIFT